MSDTGRTVRTAQTYVAKAVAVLMRDAQSEIEPVRELAGYDATQFLWMALSDLAVLTSIVDPTDEPPSAEREARRIVERIKSRRIAEKLKNVKGRTAEEAEMFFAKAHALDPSERP